MLFCIGLGVGLTVAVAVVLYAALVISRDWDDYD